MTASPDVPGAAHVGVEWQTGLQSVDSGKLPTAESDFHGADPVVGPAVAAAEGQFVKSADDEAVGHIQVRQALFQGKIPEILRALAIVGAASIVGIFFPGERAWSPASRW